MTIGSDTNVMCLRGLTVGWRDSWQEQKRGWKGQGKRGKGPSTCRVLPPRQGGITQHRDDTAPPAHAARHGHGCGGRGRFLKDRENPKMRGHTHFCESSESAPSGAAAEGGARGGLMISVAMTRTSPPRRAGGPHKRGLVTEEPPPCERPFPSQQEALRLPSTATRVRRGQGGEAARLRDTEGIAPQFHSIK